MWFGFGLITLIAGFLLSIHARTRARWPSVPVQQLGLSYLYQEVRQKQRLRLVRIGLPAPNGFHFTARSERLFDTLSNWIGISVEMQIRDPQFDRTVYLEADAKGVATLLSEHESLRKALLEMLAYARTHHLRRVRIRCAYKRLWIEFRPKREDALFGAVRALVPMLSRLADGMHASKIGFAQLRDPFVWRAAALLSISTAAAVLGVYGLMRSIAGRTDILEPWQLLGASAIPGVLGAGCFIMVVLAVLGRSSRAHLVLVEGMLVGGIGFVLSTYALAREANIEFDSGQAQSYVLHNIRAEHRITRGRRGRQRHQYYLHTSDWRPGKAAAPLALEISRSDYYAFERRNDAVIRIKPGAFGFQWIERIEPAMF